MAFDIVLRSSSSFGITLYVPTGNLSSGVSIAGATVSGTLRELPRPEENLMLWSEDMSNAVWEYATAPTYTANAANDLSGNAT